MTHLCPPSFRLRNALGDDNGINSSGCEQYHSILRPVSKTAKSMGWENHVFLCCLAIAQYVRGSWRTHLFVSDSLRACC